MAHCPNCGRKLHIYDWKPDCPGCGVNMVYFKSNERLLEESEATEIAHAKSQPGIDRAKAGTIGTTIGKIRMAFFLLPLALLFLPLYSITVGGFGVNYNAISAVNFLQSIDTGKLLSMINPVIVAILLLAIPAVCCIVFTIMQTAAVKKKGLKRNIVFSSVSLAMVIASAVCFAVFAKAPVLPYARMVQAEADFAVHGGDRGGVNKAEQKLRSLVGDKTVDKTVLERAIADGKMCLILKNNYAYTADEVKALTEAIQNGSAVLKDEKADIYAVSDAAAAIRSAAFTYSGLQAVLHDANEEILERDDGMFTGETGKRLHDGIDKTCGVLQYAVTNAALVTNDDGRYAESSFNALQDAIQNAQSHLDALNKGQSIVDHTDEETPDTAEEIAKREKEDLKATADMLQNDFNNLNDKLSGLTDISSAAECLQTVADAEANGTLPAKVGGNVKASFGFGIFILILFYIAQLIFNIMVYQKGIEVKYTPCLIGGLPSEEYFRYVEEGVSDLEIRQKMVAALEKMQEEVRAAAAKAEEEALQERARRK